MCNVYIGFDFSINKPACTILIEKFDGKFDIDFLIWPLKLTNKEVEQYKNSDVIFKNRCLESISKNKTKSVSSLVVEHTKRSVELSEMIIHDLICLIQSKIDIKNAKIYVSSESLSFASKGNATLDLASYKGVLLSEIYQRLKPENIYTYAPISIKKIAGVSKAIDFTDKNPMISKFKEEKFIHKFKDLLINGEMIAKTNYIHCVDDIVDSYFCCKTMYIKEKLTGVEFWNE